MANLKDKIQDSIKEDRLEETLEKIIDQKVEQKIQQKQETTKEPKDKKQNISRRSFLKKLGAGAVGIGALSLSPASALNIKDSKGLKVYTDSTQNFNVKSNGNTNIPNGQLNIQGKQAATRNWTQNNFNNYTDTQARNAVTENVNIENLTTNGDAGKIPVSQGDGKLQMQEVGSSPPIYGDGNDGEIVVSSDNSYSGVYYTTRFELQAGSTITLGSSVLLIFAEEEIVIDGTIDGNAVSGGGAGGSDDESNDPLSGEDTLGIIGAEGSGGAGSTTDGGDGGPGAGGGGSGDTEYNDPGADGGSPSSKIEYSKNLRLYPSNAYDTIISERVIAGNPGAGGGSAYGSAEGGKGGNGGGGIILCAPNIVINGTITLDGGNGKDGQDGDPSTGVGGGGGGGVGSGGLLTIIGESIEDNSTFSASGGTGGTGGDPGAYGDGKGGNGGDGKSGQKIIITS